MKEIEHSPCVLRFSCTHCPTRAAVNDRERSKDGNNESGYGNGSNGGFEM